MIQPPRKALRVFILGASLSLLSVPAGGQGHDAICGLPAGDWPVTLAAADASAPQVHAKSPVTGTPLDFFTNDGQYMPRVHCLTNEAGSPDWPWIIALIALNATVIVGYLRIFIFWRRAYLDEAREDRNHKMMQLAYIFLFCAVCGYAFSLVAFFWPAYRLLAVLMVVLNVVTWAFALNLKGFKLSLSANRIKREYDEHIQQRNKELEALVAERTAVLERVQEHTQQLALVASKTDNIVVITDVQGRITWVNASFGRVTGYSIDEAMGKKPGDLLQGADTDPEAVARIREALSRQAPVREELVNYTKDGRAYWIDIEIQPIRDDEGNVTHFMAMESDITHEKKLNEELTQAKELAESGNQAKSRFIANMSHEIRTPLTGIIGFADMLSKLDHVDTPTRKDWGHTILTSSRHLQSLLNDVLDISKIEAGKLEIETMPVSPHEVIAEIASIFRVGAHHKGLSLELACPNPLPETIQTDPTRLKQILSNLVGNAIKFTEKGSIRIEADIVQYAPNQPELLRIDVVDTGPGMSPEHLGKLFQAFAQADASVTRKFGGTGLGLSISRSLAEALGGGLTVESREGFGSRFIVTIDPGDIAHTPRTACIESQTDHTNDTGATPSADATRDGSATPAPMTETSAQPSDAPPATAPLPEVLLADDGETNRKLFTISLRQAGVAVTAVADGKAALDALIAEPSRYKLVLMDMQMPEMDGFEATQRARDAGVTCPIYALTASVLKGDRERCLAVGCDDYLSKPIEPARLMQVVQDAIARPATPADTDTCDDQPAPPDSGTEAEATQPTTADDADGAPIMPTLDPDLPEAVELVTSYANELSRYLDEAEQAMREHDSETVAKLAHKVLGSGETMGYSCLSAPAEALEQAANAQALEDAAAQLDQLKQLCERIQLGAAQVTAES